MCRYGAAELHAIAAFIGECTKRDPHSIARSPLYFSLMRKIDSSGEHSRNHSKHSRHCFIHYRFGNIHFDFNFFHFFFTPVQVVAPPRKSLNWSPNSTYRWIILSFSIRSRLPRQRFVCNKRKRRENLTKKSEKKAQSTMYGSSYSFGSIYE